VPFGREQHQHPRRAVHGAAVALVRHVDKLRPQPRLVRGQLRAGRAAPRGERPQDALAGLPQPPGRVRAAHAPLRQVPFQVPPHPSRDVVRAGPLHDGEQRDRHHEDRAPHAEHPGDPALRVQRLVHRLDRGGRNAGPRGQVHGHRVGGVQRDHGLGGGGDRRGRSAELVPREEPGPALGFADL
jgi:hypothetical protein